MELWRKNRLDFYAWLGCIVVCLSISVEIGLLFGIALNAFRLLFLWARPTTNIMVDEKESVTFIRVTPTSGMFYPAIDHLRETVNKTVEDFDFRLPVVVDCSKLTGLDYTTAQVFLSKKVICIFVMNNFLAGNLFTSI